jgi:MYXO-CTERM domain-containing protein
MSLKTVSLFLGASCLAATSSFAAVFLNEHFDTYPDQAAFQSTWAINGTASTVLNSAQSVSPNQSVEGLTTATRNVLTIGEVGFVNGSSDTVIFRFNFYDSNGSAAAYRQFAELDDTTAPSGSGQLFAMGLNNNIASTYYMARILGGDGGSGVSAFFKLDGGGAPTRTTGWHTLEADITDTSVSYYVDSILSKTVDISALTDRSLDSVKVGSNLSATQVAYFDDIYVERLAVPEPSTAAFGLLAAAFAFLRRRRYRL